MNINTKYIYRLGHQPEFGANEFKFLTGFDPEFYNHNYLFSNQDLAVNKTGALVFKAEIITTTSRDQVNFKNFLTDNLKKAFELFPAKKIGIALPNSELNEKQIILMAKTIGYKKINLLSPGKEPTIGNFINTANWLIALELENNWVLARVTEFSNQEFWSLLDQQLPITDMKRGVINLKLARTLMNFTDSKKIWDPFCGVGRNLIAGIDLKKEFIASDISPECLPEAIKNYNFSLDFYPNNQDQAKLKDIFEADITTLNSDNTGLFNDFSISTEGYLGHNFTNKPTFKEMQQELKKITSLWQLALKNFETLKITEIVTCLPFYYYQKEYVKLDLESLLTDTKYKYQLFINSKKSLFYRRKDSFVGHQVIKLKLVID
jgi:tRNA G10  N-methylase Trm11